MDSHLVKNLANIRKDVQTKILDKIEGLDQLGTVITEFYSFREAAITQRKEIDAGFKKFNQEINYLMSHFE